MQISIEQSYLSLVYSISRKYRLVPLGLSYITLSISSLSFSEILSKPEELLVVDVRNQRSIDVAETTEIVPDAAVLLRKAPGANVNGNGPLSGIPQYRGMYGSRISTDVNGMTLSSGGPNWMDPPLHYAPAGQLESLEIYRGIAPVSAGQETIGGVVSAKTWEGEFGVDTDFKSSARIRAGAQSANDAGLLSVSIVGANARHRIKLSGLTEMAGDTHFSNGSIAPSEYERDRFDLGYGYRQNNHEWQISAGRNETGNGGTPALPMDIIYIDADMVNSRYRFKTDEWSLSTNLYMSDITHGMSNYHLRQAPATGMWRRNTALGESIGFKIIGDINTNRGSWSIGIDGHSELHNSDIDNPNNPMFFVTSFNEAEREILGLFAENKLTINAQWSIEAGLRFNRVTMDSDTVDATPARIMMPATALRDDFNRADRSTTDNNIDWMGRFSYQQNTVNWYLGFAQKTRSTSHQERYLWLPLQSTGGLADGRTYTGNLTLEPEKSTEIEFGFDLTHDQLSVSPGFFYRHVDDYIQGTVSTNMNAIMFVNMMNLMMGTNNAQPLEFNNVKARLYGMDMDWAYQINNNWSANGLINYVRGERDDINDNLYRISPLNGSIVVNYFANRWSLTLESLIYAKQDKVSLTNGEKRSGGYGLLNIRGNWQISEYCKIGFGVDNIIDKQYANHLSGYNRAINPDIALGEHLPGTGRNVFTRLDYQW